VSLFARPWALWLLAILIPLLILELRSAVMTSRAAGGLWGRARFPTRRALARACLRLACLAGLALALAGPRLGARLSRRSDSGLDLVIALDVSRSMLAEEEGRTRLERARSIAREAMAELPGARLALVAFKGRPITLFPLSQGRETLDLALEAAAPGMMSAPGTDLGAALLECLRASDSATARSRAVLLLSDGEDLGGRIGEACARLAEAGLPVCAVGLGSDSGSLVPPSAAGGQAHLSRRDQAALRGAARASGGVYAAEEDGGGMRALWAFLASRGSGAGRVKREAAATEAPFLIIALACALAASLLPAAAPQARARRLLGALLLVLLGGLSSCARAAQAARVAQAVSLARKGAPQEASAILVDVLPRLGRRDAAVARFDLAACCLALGEPAMAADLLERALPDAPPSERAAFHFNLGCARYAQGSYRQAWAAFRACLTEDPGFADARANLELAWARAEEEAVPAAAEAAALRLAEILEGERSRFDIVRAMESGRFRSGDTADEGAEDDY